MSIYIPHGLRVCPAAYFHSYRLGDTQMCGETGKRMTQAMCPHFRQSVSQAYTIDLIAQSVGRYIYHAAGLVFNTL